MTETPVAAARGAYEQVAYPGFAYPATHPGRHEVLGRLFGLEPASAARCRVLELGCGDGVNALSIAQTLPGAEVLGIDASADAIARGTALARAAGLENVVLRHAEIERLPDDLGSIDYVVAHGVYSWIPPAARAALLACCRERLRPDGIAFVSYNAYPGSHLRDMARDVLRYHLRGVDDPQRRLAGAHELMRTIVAIEAPAPYARVLREQMERMLGWSDVLLFHDDLAEISTPFYFHEFAEQAAGHGLRFLSEADLFESRLDDVPAAAEQLMQGLGDDVVAREQYLDFFKNRMFRQTLLCHAEAPVRRALDDGHLTRFAISAAVRAAEPGGDGADPAAATFTTDDGFSMTTSEPHVVAAMEELARAWPEALGFEDLTAAAQAAAGPAAPADLVAARLRSVLLEAYLARVVLLHGCPPPVVRAPGARPCASPLARAQGAAGADGVSTLLHTTARLEDPLARLLLPLLDGTRTRDELAGELAAAAGEVDAALRRLASAGLLQG